MTVKFQRNIFPKKLFVNISTKSQIKQTNIEYNNLVENIKKNCYFLKNLMNSTVFKAKKIFRIFFLTIKI